MIVQSLGLPLRLSQRSIDNSHAVDQAPIAAGHTPVAAGHTSISEDEDPTGAPSGLALDRRVLGCEVPLWIDVHFVVKRASKCSQCTTQWCGHAAIGS
jgi:hypothetical protein